MNDTSYRITKSLVSTIRLFTNEIHLLLLIKIKIKKISWIVGHEIKVEIPCKAVQVHFCVEYFGIPPFLFPLFPFFNKEKWKNKVGKSLKQKLMNGLNRHSKVQMSGNYYITWCYIFSYSRFSNYICGSYWSRRDTCMKMRKIPIHVSDNSTPST